ncbi:MAG TPA: uracil phosphoribosyltransferase [Candidatus Elarobacter sp.]
MSAPLIVNHPAVHDRLARLRDATTPTPVFRRLVEELGQLLAYEATRALPQTEIELQTPVGLAKVHRIATRPVVAPILRAGLGLLPGFMAVVDDAVVAHLGFYRDPKTLAAIPYYANLPDDLAERDVFVLDPMLATGNSGSAALRLLEEHGARAPVFVCIIAAPEGMATLAREHPDVTIVTAAVDEKLNDHGYIVPGLGDAGDRMFGSTSSVPVSARQP